MCRQDADEGLWGALRHAFSIPREEQLSEREKLWLDRIARKVVQRRLSAPALMMIESVRPLNYVGAHVILFFKPIISLLFPPRRCDEVVALLQKRSALRKLARRIEHLEREKEVSRSEEQE